MTAVPAEATTAVTVFPRKHGVAWVAPLPRTISGCNKQEGEVIKNMVMSLIAAYHHNVSSYCFPG